MKLITKLRNIPYPSYSTCYKCGGNWGWKEGVTHMTEEHSGLFLFCEECDKTVTIEERREALDEWRIKAIIGMIPCAHTLRFAKMFTTEETLKEIRGILNTEFIEFPKP